MLRLRCPHQGCAIEVADDMVGARIRCPHCAQLLFVNPEPQQSTDVTATPEHRLYAGLPPLAVMLGVREGRGPARDDHGAAGAQMTDADWKALALPWKEVIREAGLPLSCSYWVIAPTTSPNPPVLENGTPSEAANAICMRLDPLPRHFCGAHAMMTIRPASVVREIHRTAEPV